MGEPTILAFAAQAPAALRRQLDATRARIASASAGERLATTAARLLDRLPTAAPIRAAFVASTAREALAALADLDDWLGRKERRPLRASRGVVLASGDEPPRIGLLLSGQGARVPRGVGAVAERFPEAAALHASARIPSDDGAVPPEASQLAIVAASLTAIEVVRRLGVVPGFALGHSLGELSALCWAGAYDPATALRLARARGEATVSRGPAAGGMAMVQAAPELVAELIAGSSLSIACFNGPARHVVAGDSQEIDELVTRARAREVTAERLEIPGAFHSPLMRDAAQAFARALAELPALPLDGRVISSVTGTWLAPDVDLRRHLHDQLLTPVRFHEAARVAAAHADLLIEAGPAATLASLMGEIADTPVVPVRIGDRSVRPLLELVATTWAAGITTTVELVAQARAE